jgi:hypothetical protein
MRDFKWGWRISKYITNFWFKITALIHVNTWIIIALLAFVASVALSASRNPTSTNLNYSNLLSTDGLVRRIVVMEDGQCSALIEFPSYRGVSRNKLFWFLVDCDLQEDQKVTIYKNDDLLLE